MGYTAFPAPMPAPIPPGPKPASTKRKAKPGQAPALGRGMRLMERLRWPRGCPPAGVKGCGGDAGASCPLDETPVPITLPGAGRGSGRVLAESRPQPNTASACGLTAASPVAECQQSQVAPSRVRRHHDRARQGSPEGPPRPRRWWPRGHGGCEELQPRSEGYEHSP